MLQVKEISVEELSASSQMVLLPALNQVIDMTKKEEEILFPTARAHFDSLRSGI